MTTQTLVILRHAKAAQPDGIADTDRSLTARGRVDAAAAGAWLARHHPPDLVLCSPARRTRETWLGVAPALAAVPTVGMVEEIYPGSAGVLLGLLTDLSEAVVSTVLLIGHNPAVTQLSALLDATGNPEGLRTAEAAVHTSQRPWRDWAPGTATRTATHVARG